MRRRISRRNFLKLAGGTVATAAGMSLLPRFIGGKKAIDPLSVHTAEAQDPPPDLFFAGTDGWIYLPPDPAIPPFHPDDLAPPPFNTYIFGFQNVTHLLPSKNPPGTDPVELAAKVAAQKMQAQHSAPLFWAKEGVELRLKLTNLGLQMRPDLVDAHTVHWHGFRNATPFFDGEPNSSVSVPIGREFTYIYRPHEPGTYMYHCHVEDVEHVHMGMTGLLFVRPAQDGTAYTYNGRTFTQFAYNDGDGSTGFDREFAMFLSEVWAEAHWADSHIQLPEWSDYRPDFNLLNGRVYPDTLAPNGSVDPFNPVRAANGDMIPPVDANGNELTHLKYQPYSSLVQCEPGEQVLLRFANLGFTRQSMTLAGIKMRVVGKDATLLRGRNGEDLSYETDTISIGAGESFDVIFTAPPFQGGGANGYDTYMLFNRNFNRTVNGAGIGGQATEIRVFPSGTLGPQLLPQT